MRRPKRCSRAVVLLGFAALLAGPTPGAVGSCSGDDDALQEPVDFERYCSEREQLVCVRRYERGEVSLEARDNCRRRVIELCAQRSFAPGCRPTRREANACLNALHSRSTLDREINELEECRSLCSIPLEEEEARSIEPEPDAGAEDER